MVIAAIIGGTVAAVGTYEIWKFDRRRRLDSDRLRDLRSRRVTDYEMDRDFQKFSCLIAGVYARMRLANPALVHDVEPPEAFFGSAGYREVDNLPEYLNERTQDDTRSAILAAFDAVSEEVILLRPNDDKKKATGIFHQQKESNGTFHLVVAVRGTLCDRVEDLIDDLRVVTETLPDLDHKYMPIVRFILALSRMPLRVTVVGHSLGAAFALLSARTLALSGVVVSCHLFNLPNFTTDVMVKKMYQSSVNAASDCIGYIAGDRAKAWISNGGQRFASSFSRKAELALAVDRQLLDEARRLRVSGFRPQIYVNRRDTISNEYCNLLVPGRRPRFQSIGSRLIGRIFRGVNTYHMVPRGDLIISNVGEGFTLAHSLAQWYLMVNRDPGCDVQYEAIPPLEDQDYAYEG